MERIRCGLSALRKNRRSGLAMMIALCACVLLLSLTLRLFYMSGVRIARAGRKVELERCRLLADTFAAALEVELRKYGAEGNEAESGTFYNRVNEFLEDPSYADYDPSDPSTVISFKQDGGSRDDSYGELEIRLRKTDLMDSPSGKRGTFRDEITAVHDTAFDSYGSFDYGGAAQGTRTAERDNKFIRYQVQVDVCSALGEESFLRSAEYYREDCYQPRYTWHVTNLESRPADFELYRPVEGTQLSPIDGVPVFWDPVDRKFFRDRERTLVIEPSTWRRDEPADGFFNADGDSYTWTEKVTISYVYYDESGDFHATFKRFVPV